MARVPYSPVPSVEPAATLPEDYQNIQPRAAEGLQQLGEGASKAGQFFGEVAADQASNNFQQQATDLVTSYKGLRGQDAIMARPQVNKQLDQLLKSTRATLYTPQQQLQFDNYSRRVRTYLDSDIGSHFDQQQMVWATGVYSNTENQAINGIASNPDDPDLVLHNASDLVGARIKAAQLQYGQNLTSDMKNQIVAQGRRDAFKAQVTAIGVTDPARAVSMLDANRNLAGADYPDLVRRFQGGADLQVGVNGGNRAVTGSPSAGQVYNAVIGQESGGDPNAPTSTNGAVGIGQVEPATFARYARTGEKIDNPADNAAVSRRIIEDYYRRYAGDSARVATAYFSGPQNVAPTGSPTPWIKDKHDANGKSVSSYVADVTTRLGPAQPAVSREEAEKRVLGDPGLSAPQKTHALATIGQVYAAQDGERRTVGQLIKDDQASILSGGQPEASLTPDRVRTALGPEEAAEFSTNRGIAQNYWQQTHDWASLSASEIHDRVQLLTPTPGMPGFAYAQRLQEHAAKNADQMLQKRYDDPAGAVEFIPAVATARAAAQTNPAAYPALVGARVLAETKLGIPDGAQSPIPDEEAKRYAALLRPVSTGQADVQNQSEAINAVVKEVHDKYGPYAQAAMSRVLLHVTMKQDAADVLAAAMEHYRNNQPGPLVSPEDAHRVQVERDADRAAQIGGIAQPNMSRQPAPSIQNGSKKPFWQAQDLLRADPDRLLGPFIQRFGVDAVPPDLVKKMPPDLAAKRLDAGQISAMPQAGASPQ